MYVGCQHNVTLLSCDGFPLLMPGIQTGQRNRFLLNLPEIIIIIIIIIIIMQGTHICPRSPSSLLYNG